VEVVRRCKLGAILTRECVRAVAPSIRGKTFRKSVGPPLASGGISSSTTAAQCLWTCGFTPSPSCRWTERCLRATLPTTFKGHEDIQVGIVVDATEESIAAVFRRDSGNSADTRRPLDRDGSTDRHRQMTGH